MKKLIVEFIGAFILVFTIGNTVSAHEALAPLAIGAALMVAIYAGGPVSGAHYNPAVSVALWRRGALSTGELLPYISVQVLGAAVAALSVNYLHGRHSAGAGEAWSGKIFLAEALWTCVLAFVVMHVATTKKAAGNSYFGLAIGFTVFAGAVGLGSISGGVFNPAVFVGLCVMGLKGWSSIALFFIAQILGGLIAAELFKRTNPDV